MNAVSQISPQDFINILSKTEMQMPESIPEYPMEYFIGPSFIFLYKQIGTKIYKTEIKMDKIVLTDTEELPEQTVMWKNNKVTVNQLIEDVRTNHSARQIYKPIDYHTILIQHIHDLHTHAGQAPNDVYDMIGM